MNMKFKPLYEVSAGVVLYNLEMLSPCTFNGFSLPWDKVSYLTKVPKTLLIATDSIP